MQASGTAHRSSAHLAQRTWTDVADLKHAERVLVVPVGATEQHGPHLPLSTDTDIALALAEMLAETHGDLSVAPAVAYGASAEHQAFAGTVSVGQRATELFLVELGRSASASFDHLVLLSTHGGNAEAVARVARCLRAEGTSVVAWSPQWHGDAHAGRTETSVMLALHPESVRLGEAAPGNTRRLVELMPALRAKGVAAVSPNGVLGDPTGASADEGRRLLREAVLDLADSLARTIAVA